MGVPMGGAAAFPRPKLLYFRALSSVLLPVPLSINSTLPVGDWHRLCLTGERLAVFFTIYTYEYFVLWFLFSLFHFGT
jgi:hypothetical protein